MSAIHVAVFGTRGLSFSVPDDEMEHLQNHIDTLVESAFGMNQILAQFDQDDDTGLSIDRRRAQVGTTFVSAMALELTSILRAAEAKIAKRLMREGETP